jgi:hypothetical protein
VKCIQNLGSLGKWSLVMLRGWEGNIRKESVKLNMPLCLNITL